MTIPIRRINAIQAIEGIKLIERILIVALHVETQRFFQPKPESELSEQVADGTEIAREHSAPSPLLQLQPDLTYLGATEAGICSPSRFVHSSMMGLAWVKRLRAQRALIHCFK
jgi:hypothetical protein